jgi:hypothetical protein
VAGIVDVLCTHGMTFSFTCACFARARSFVVTSTNTLPFSSDAVGCLALARLANSDERAKQLFLAHPNLITSVKNMIRDVAETEDNKDTLGFAHRLLARFNDKVRLACSEELREDQLRLNQAAEQEIKSQKRTIEELTSEKSELRERIVELEKDLELAKSSAGLDRS